MLFFKTFKNIAKVMSNKCFSKQTAIFAGHLCIKVKLKQNQLLQVV